MTKAQSQREAETKVCHVSRGGPTDQNCIASKCMAWEFTSNAPPWKVREPGKSDRMSHGRRPDPPPGGSVNVAPPGERLGICTLLWQGERGGV